MSSGSDRRSSPPATSPVAASRISKGSRKACSRTSTRTSTVSPRICPVVKALRPALSGVRDPLLGVRFGHDRHVKERRDIPERWPTTTSVSRQDPPPARYGGPARLRRRPRGRDRRGEHIATRSAESEHALTFGNGAASERKRSSRTTQEAEVPASGAHLDQDVPPRRWCRAPALGHLGQPRPRTDSSRPTTNGADSDHAGSAAVRRVSRQEGTVGRERVLASSNGDFFEGAPRGAPHAHSRHR